MTTTPRRSEREKVFVFVCLLLAEMHRNPMQSNEIRNPQSRAHPKRILAGRYSRQHSRNSLATNASQEDTNLISPTPRFSDKSLLSRLCASRSRFNPAGNQIIMGPIFSDCARICERSLRYSLGRWLLQLQLQLLSLCLCLLSCLPPPRFISAATWPPD